MLIVAVISPDDLRTHSRGSGGDQRTKCRHTHTHTHTQISFFLYSLQVILNDESDWRGKSSPENVPGIFLLSCTEFALGDL